MAYRPNLFGDDATLMYKGLLFEVWQRQQTMFDGSTRTFEYVRGPNSAQVIPIVGDTIMILQQQYPDQPEPFLGLPGGRCDTDDEDVLAVAKRELLEESGYVSDDWKLWMRHPVVGKIQWPLSTYIARNCRPKEGAELDDKTDTIKVQFVTFDELLLLCDNPKFFRERELMPILLHARLDPAKREQLRRDLFD